MAADRIPKSMYIILSRRKANSDCCRSLLIKSRHHPSSPERKNHVETASNRRRRNIFLLCTDLLPAASFACDSPGISASAGPFTPSFVGPCASEQRTAPRLPFFPASISDFTTIHRVIRRLGLGPLRPPSLPCASRRGPRWADFSPHVPVSPRLHRVLPNSASRDPDP